MTILLKEIWQVENPSDFKVHFARWNGHTQPLEVFVRDREEWQGWQESRPSRNEFNRPFIFSFVQFYHETDTWLFGGVFRVMARHDDGYEVQLLNSDKGFIGRLKLHAPYRGRPWCAYVTSGHGGNVELRALVSDPTLDYCRTNFRFALLEHRSSRTPDDVVLAREAFWKRILLTRGAQGLNRN